MNKIFSKTITLMLTLTLALIMAASCTSSDDWAGDDYGYVQFRLEKAVTSRAVSIERMADAAKIEVMLRHDGTTITQTLSLSSRDDEAAEYGVRSEKLQLLKGEYSIMGFYVYDKLDQKISAGVPDDNTFTIVGGGLETKTIPVDAQLRGTVSFELVKKFVGSRASSGATYMFKDIKRVDVIVKNTATSEVTNIKDILVDYEETFADSTVDTKYHPGEHAETAHSVGDTIVWLKAGDYVISGYTTYSTKAGTSGVLETASVGDENFTFSVADNKETEAQVPILLSTTAAYLRDYVALYDIWESLGGKNWAYHGDEYVEGVNWNFNKDFDMWGDQPGVTLNGSGRVTALSIAGFGAKGVVPDAIGQLSQLVILSLGTHDESINGKLFSVIDANDISQAKLMSVRHDYETRFLKHDIRDAMSQILVDGVNRGDIKQAKIQKDSRISLKDNTYGVLTNGITGISRALLRCTNLQQFYIANSPVTYEEMFRDIDPTSEFYASRENLSWSNMTMLTDIELYNLPKLTRLPMEMFNTAGLPNVELLNVACNRSISGGQLKSDLEGICNGASAGKLQILYCGYNNLEETPGYNDLHKLLKLSLLDLTNNKIRVLHPFGKEINLNTVYLDYNEIESVPTDGEGYFFGYYDTETFSISHNKLTMVPDIFNANSSYLIDQVDFSNNDISGFEHGDSYRGVNASTVNLSVNKLTTFPKPLFAAGSPITSLNLMGNLIASFPNGAMTGPKSRDLQSLDITYNKLTDLPEDFYATNVPYFYGIDVSFNSLTEFPWEVLDGTRITVIGCRGQRDAAGNRTLREWPTGIYKSPSMAALYLGGNDIRKVEDTISPYIYILDIKDNPNISIDVSDVCYYIGAGTYTLLYDPTQDIRGCDSYISK